MHWMAQDLICQKFTSRGPFKGDVTQQVPGGPNGAKWGPKGARPLKTCLQAPQSIYFGPKHILDALEWVGRPQDPTCQNFTSRGLFKGDVTQQVPGGQNGAKWGPNGCEFT